MRFNQSRWMESYIDKNSQKRKEAKNDFEKNFYKLFNNAVFGKTMENERKRVDVKIVTHWDGRYGAEALIARPNYRSSSYFGDDVVAIELTRTDITITKPIYVGLSVLDLSKIRLYRFHYEFMRQNLRDQCKVLYIDTDSLIYEIRGVNIYEFMKSNINEFDTADYSHSNVYGIPLMHGKEVGLMKDECKGRIMTKFAGLRSKVYSLQVQGMKDIKKAKGVKSAVVDTTIEFHHYVSCLMNNLVIQREQKNICSRLHIVRTEKQMKVALSPDDDKRCLLHAQTDTLPWGHHTINEEEVRQYRENQRKLGRILRRQLQDWDEEDEELLKILVSDDVAVQGNSDCCSVDGVSVDDDGAAARCITKGPSAVVGDGMAARNTVAAERRAAFKRAHESLEHSRSLEELQNEQQQQQQQKKKKNVSLDLNLKLFPSTLK